MTHGLRMPPDVMRELATHVTEILVERNAGLREGPSSFSPPLSRTNAVGKSAGAPLAHPRSSGRPLRDRLRVVAPEPEGLGPVRHAIPLRRWATARSGSRRQLDHAPPWTAQWALDWRSLRVSPRPPFRLHESGPEIVACGSRSPSTELIWKGTTGAFLRAPGCIRRRARHGPRGGVCTGRRRARVACSKA